MDTNQLNIANLVGSWSVIAASDQDEPLPLPNNVSLDVDEDGSYQIYAGCNRLGGSFSVEEGRIRSSPLWSTRMACPPPVARVEMLFSRIMTDPFQVGLDEETLIIRSPGAQLRLIRE